MWKNKITKSGQKNETFPSLSKTIPLAQGQGHLGELRIVQTGLATSLLKNGLRMPCLYPVVTGAF